MIDVIVPCVRAATVSRLLASLAAGTEPPDHILIVSNEIDDLDNHGLPVTILGFSSRFYPFGHGDVALRRNIGAWYSQADQLLFIDDDEVAPPTLIADVRAKLDRQRYVWGHHRFSRFAGRSVADIMAMPRELGVSRENPEPPYWHGWQSCYAGLFGIDQDLFLEIGGFDLLFLGRHESEDQNLGKRLQHYMGWPGGFGRVLIEEPPFIWHPIEHESWEELPIATNCCSEHALETERFHDVLFERCTLCPYFRAISTAERFTMNTLVVPFDPDLVETHPRGAHACLLP